MEQSVITSVAASASAAADYSRFASVMDQYGYDWEAVEVVTEDDYLLTAFHVLGRTGTGEGTAEAPSKGSVLTMHGDLMDGTDWLASFSEGRVPFHLLLADQGYDVWIGNQRGSTYCQKHRTLDPREGDFWKFGWKEEGLGDGQALIRAVKERMGVEKVFYIGYSNGTIQMFYALAHDQPFFSANVHKVVQMAPCFLSNTGVSASMLDNDEENFAASGIYAINGPTWKRDLVTICKDFSKDACGMFASLTGYGAQAVQEELQWDQNWQMQRFQELAPEWSAGKREMPLVPLENITDVPIAMFIGKEDTGCPYAYGKDYVPRIRSHIDEIFVEGADHGYWCDFESDWVMQQLLAQLQVPTQTFLE